MKIIEEITDLFDWIKNKKEYQNELSSSEKAYTYELSRARKLRKELDDKTAECNVFKEKYNRVRKKYKNMGGK